MEFSVVIVKGLALLWERGEATASISLLSTLDIFFYHYYTCREEDTLVATAAAYTPLCVRPFLVTRWCGDRCDV